MHQGHVHDPEEERADRLMRSYSRAVGLESEGMYDEAIAQHGDIVKTDPHFEQAHHGLARAYLRKGLYGKAIGVLKNALGFHPRSSDIHYHLARTYSDSGDVDSAIAHLERAVELGYSDAGQIAEDDRCGRLPSSDPRFQRVLHALEQSGRDSTGKGSPSHTVGRKQPVR